MVIVLFLLTQCCSHTIQAGCLSLPACDLSSLGLMLSSNSFVLQAAATSDGRQSWAFNAASLIARGMCSKYYQLGLVIWKRLPLTSWTVRTHTARRCWCHAMCYFMNVCASSNYDWNLTITCDKWTCLAAAVCIEAQLRDARRHRWLSAGIHFCTSAHLCEIFVWINYN